MDKLNATTGETGESTRVVYCAQCGTPPGTDWAKWRAYRTDDSEYNEPPAIVFHCPACARALFGAT